MQCLLAIMNAPSVHEKTLDFCIGNIIIILAFFFLWIRSSALFEFRIQFQNYESYSRSEGPLDREQARHVASTYTGQHNNERKSHILRCPEWLKLLKTARASNSAPTVISSYHNSDIRGFVIPCVCAVNSLPLISLLSVQAVCVYP